MYQLHYLDYWKEGDKNRERKFKKKNGKDEIKSMRNCAKDRNIGTEGNEFSQFLQPFQNKTVIVHQVLLPSTVQSKSLIRHYITSED